MASVHLLVQNAIFALCSSQWSSKYKKPAVRQDRQGEASPLSIIWKSWDAGCGPTFSFLREKPGAGGFLDHMALSWDTGASRLVSQLLTNGIS